MRRYLCSFLVLFLIAYLQFGCFAFGATQLKNSKPTPEKKSTIDIFGQVGRAVVMVTTDTGQGSGVVISKEGLMVTNYHVVQNASTASVKTTDGQTIPVEGIIEMDAKRDLALLKIKPGIITPVQLGDSSQVRIGQKVIAIGNPQGLQNTVSEGTISHIRSDVNVRGIEIYKGFKVFQITAAISPGSSGGALLDENGLLIGITSSSLTLAGTQNVNFSIPIDYVKPMLGTEIIKKFGEPSSVEFTGIVSEKFMEVYLELAQKITQSMVDLYQGEENTWMAEDFKADQLFYQTRTRISGLLSIYNLTPLEAISDLEKSTQVKTKVILLNLLKSSETFIQAFEKQGVEVELKIAKASLQEAIVLFYETASKLFKSQISATSKEQLLGILKQYPVFRKGEPYYGLVAIPKDKNTALVVCVYPNSPAEEANIQEFDIISVENDVLQQNFNLLYKSHSLTVKRNKDEMMVSIRPIRYKFKNKPVVIGLTRWDNESITTSGHDMLRNIIFQAFNRYDNVLAFPISTLDPTSSSSNIMEEAKKYDANYILTGKVTKFQGESFQDFWTGRTGWKIKLIAVFTLYDNTGKIIATHTGEESLEAASGSDNERYKAVARKLSNKVIGEIKNIIKF